MIYSITFHPKALEEYRIASIWYEEQQGGLGLRFEKAIDQKIQQILDNPLVFTASKTTYRQAKASVFPFVIVFKVNSIKHTIYISSIYHTSRHPKDKFRKEH